MPEVSFAPVRLARLLRGLVLGSARGPLRRAWVAGHLLIARATAVWLRSGTGATVFLRGSFATGEAEPGLSDIDLVAVTPGPEELNLSLLSLRRRRLGLLARHISIATYSLAELEDALAGTILDYRIDEPVDGDPRSRAILLAPAAPADELGVRVRPPLGKPTERWRRLAGPGLPLAVAEQGPAERASRAWLEIQYWWRHAFRLAADPGRLDAPYMAFKLVAEPAAALLWAATGTVPRTRLEALSLLADAHPEDAEVVLHARELERGLPRADLHAVLASLARTSERLAATAEAVAGPPTDVALLGDPGEGALPLVDWRALCYPAAEEEQFRLVDGEPADPVRLAEIAGERPLAALRGERLMVTPGSGSQRVRSATCRATDPVSFAVLSRSDRATFPDLPGWRAHDRALRAVAEHRAWLSRRAAGGQRLPGGRTPELLLTAARAAAFLESIDGGSAGLAITTDGLIGHLEDIGSPAATPLREVAEALTAARAGRGEPDGSLVLEAEDAVTAMPAFSAMSLPAKPPALWPGKRGVVSS